MFKLIKGNTMVSGNLQQFEASESTFYVVMDDGIEITVNNVRPKMVMSLRQLGLKSLVNSVVDINKDSIDLKSKADKVV